MADGSERVAIVTGAGAGVGRATALGLADDGFQFVLAERRKERLDSVLAERPGPWRRDRVRHHTERVPR